MFKAIRHVFNAIWQVFLGKRVDRKSTRRQTSEESGSHESGPYFRWGPAKLPDQGFQSHSLAISTTGGGKTLTIRMLQQDVLKHIGKGIGYRALVYDAKGDALPILSSIVDPALIKTFNPFDQRGVAWWVSRDIRESAVAIEFAETLIPDKNESQPFFSTASREIIWGIVMAFNQAKLEWRLSDLIRASRNAVRCKRLLEQNQYTEYLVETYLTDPKLSSDIFATLRGYLKPLEPVAACWDHANEQIAIRDIVEEKEMVVVLGNVEKSRVAIDRINNVIWERYVDLVLSQPDDTDKRFWAFIDELSEANLKNLTSFAKRSRSKGGRLVCSMQSLAGLFSERLFGEHRAKDLLSCFSNRFIGKLECELTADWVSRFIGEREQIQRSFSESFGPNGQKSESHSPVIKKTVLPSELMSMPPSGPKTGLVGLFTFRSKKPAWCQIPPKELFDELLMPKHPDVKEFIERDPDTQLLKPWTDQEVAIFCPEKKKPDSDSNGDDVTRFEDF